MANYLLVYHGGGGMAATPEAQQAAMAQWGQWFGQLGAAVVDGGNPVGQERTIGGNGAAANAVSGYSVLKADSLDAAVKLTEGCPVLAAGGSVQVCETFDAM